MGGVLISLSRHNMKLNYTILLRHRPIDGGTGRREAETKRESEEPVFMVTTCNFFFLFSAFELLSSFVNDLAVSVR